MADEQPSPAKGVTFASGPPAVAPTPAATAPTPRMTKTPSHSDTTLRARAHEALGTLLEGNARFVSGAPLVRARADPGALISLTDDANARPLAAILACSDARCPPELLFDAGVGDVAVVRVAGGALDPIVLDSVIAAVTHNGARLVVVLGHTRCAAVRRAVARYVAKESRGGGGGGGGSGRRSASAVDGGGSGRRAGADSSASASPFASPAPSTSASAAAASTSPSWFTRIATSCGCGAPPAVSKGGSRSSAGHPPAPPRRLSSDRRTSADRSTASGVEGFLARASATPLAAVSDALAGAVAAVAKARGGLGRAVGDNDEPLTLADDAAARRLALRSQDSLSLNHARLAREKLRRDESEAPDEQAAVEDDVVAEHTKRAAAAVLAALVARDPETAREVEVVAARVDYWEGGKVHVLRRGWLGARGPLYE